MRTIEANQANQHFDGLLTDVENGETLVITRLGQPVALFGSMDQEVDAATAIEEWRRYRREHNITLGDGVTIRELIEEGRE